MYSLKGFSIFYVLSIAIIFGFCLQTKNVANQKTKCFKIKNLKLIHFYMFLNDGSYLYYKAIG
jgi:hypothetical protein